MSIDTYQFSSRDDGLADQLKQIPGTMLEEIDSMTDGIFNEFDWVTNPLSNIQQQAHEALLAYQAAREQFFSERKNVLLPKVRYQELEQTVAAKRQAYLRLQKELLTRVCKEK